MHKEKDILWTWLLADLPKDLNFEEWQGHGGKWIVFDDRERIIDLAGRIAPFIDSGEIESAKYWNGDPSALCVYSLDRDRHRVLEILEKSGAGDKRVWEYDYAWCKNIGRPVTFAYSWISKFSTILRSYGLLGTLDLIREVFKPRKQ